MAKPLDRKGGIQVWIGVDFDGTLAHHAPGESLSYLGAPILLMVSQVLYWHRQGWKVKIFTARVASCYADCDVQRAMIITWCRRELGFPLEVTSEKDGAMLELWDDRAVAVERNSGVRLSPSNIG